MKFSIDGIVVGSLLSVEERCFLLLCFELLVAWLLAVAAANSLTFILLWTSFWAGSE